jgi:hypothetical protein
MTENGAPPGYDTCGAARKHTGDPCTRPAGWGTEHAGYGACKLHGGCTPTHVASAQNAMALEAAEPFGLPRSIDPHQALLEELHRTAGLVAFYEVKANEDPLVESTMFGKQASIWLKLHERERKHYLDVAGTCVRVGLDERRVRLAEDQAALLAQVIRGVLSDLGLYDDPRAPEIVRRHLSLASSAA